VVPQSLAWAGPDMSGPGENKETWGPYTQIVIVLLLIFQVVSCTEQNSFEKTHYNITESNNGLIGDKSIQNKLYIYQNMHDKLTL
jgi:hypothetical protein